MRFLNLKSTRLLFCFSALGMISGAYFNQSPQQERSKMNLSELASKAPNGRTLELGKAVLSKKNADKEVEVILKDPAMSQKWGLELTGAAKAWRLSKGSKDIVVAVIDTGADINHADLKANLWQNPVHLPKRPRGALSIAIISLNARNLTYSLYNCMLKFWIF